ncbi:MAG TPA: hypothetical protein VG367_06030 [Mucilaginibacter sp.]|jgi:hypothetical protein|nr:hypothetical protein [Mucilaginibacter sp.]
MDEQFEKDLKKRISEVFDNYEDTSANEGWERLREKFPEEAKRRPVAWMWWSSAAAVLLVLLGIVWLRQTPEKQQQFTAIKKPGNTAAQSQAKVADNTQKPGDSVVTAQPERVLASKSGNNSGLRKAGNGSAIARIIRSGNQPGTAAVKVDQQHLVINGPAVASNQSNKSTQNTINQANSIAATTVQPEDNSNANTKSKNTITAAKPDSDVSRPSNSNAIASTGSEMLKNNKPGNESLAYNNAPAKQKGLPGDNRVRFGAYAATFFNYAKGSNSQFNIGAGITSDIRITRKLKLSTGLAITQNSLSYGGQPVTPVPQGINLAPLALYSANTLRYSMSEPTFKSYNASLVGIDIPVNFKYTFDPGKTETYLLAGLSSGTFVNETYTYNFNGGPSFNQATRNSGGFYFGRMLNLAIGTGYRFGSNRLIIEPFLKYPLGGMGAQQIRFGSGGVNLKFNIPSIRK